MKEYFNLNDFVENICNKCKYKGKEDCEIYISRINGHLYCKEAEVDVNVESK